MAGCVVPASTGLFGDDDWIPTEIAITLVDRAKPSGCYAGAAGAHPRA